MLQSHDVEEPARQSFALALRDEQGMNRFTFQQTVVIQTIVSDK